MLLEVIERLRGAHAALMLLEVTERLRRAQAALMLLEVTERLRGAHAAPMLLEVTERLRRAHAPSGGRRARTPGARPRSDNARFSWPGVHRGSVLAQPPVLEAPCTRAFTGIP